MKDGWYYIKTWERMEKKYGLSGTSDKYICGGYNKRIESALPPTRCVYIRNDDWAGWHINKDTIECPAIPIGAEVYVWDDDISSKISGIYCGYVFNSLWPHRIMDKAGQRLKYKFAEISKQPEIKKKSQMVCPYTEECEQEHECPGIIEYSGRIHEMAEKLSQAAFKEIIKIMVGM